jgi:hypothetical protein
VALTWGVHHERLRLLASPVLASNSSSNEHVQLPPLGRPVGVSPPHLGAAAEVVVVVGVVVVVVVVVGVGVVVVGGLCEGRVWAAEATPTGTRSASTVLAAKRGAHPWIRDRERV